GVEQLLEVAGDVVPGRRRLLVRLAGVGHRVDDVVDAVGGDGVGLVVAPDRVGDDRLNGRAVQARGDVRPLVAVGAAAGLGDEDVAPGRAGVEEVVEVADAARAVGVGGAVGQGRRVRVVQRARVADGEPEPALGLGGEDPARLTVDVGA